MEPASWVILTLKVAVSAVTVLLIASLVVLYKGHTRLHGRINVLFFTLTLITLLGFEALIQLIRPELFEYFKENEVLSLRLKIHLCFSIPSAVLMPAMLYTGLSHRRTIHIILAVLFSILWTGTFITGIFFIPLK